MDLTKEIAESYAGGHIEIQNSEEKYLFRGEIKSATVQDNALIVQPRWLAKGEGFPPLPERWVSVDPQEYGASLEVYSVSDIGNGRICLHSSILGETTVLFPKGESRLDPSEVEGLEAKF